MARLNRATTFIKVRWYQAAIEECDDIEKMINAIDAKERESDEQYYMKMLGRAYLRRASSKAWLSLYDESIEDYKKAMEFKGLYKEEEIEIMKEDIAAIEKRKESQEIKLQGDISFSLNNLNQALEHYTKALEIDPCNEYALSNIGVIYLKRQDYDACLRYTNQSLEIIDEF